VAILYFLGVTPGFPLSLAASLSPDLVGSR